MAFNPYKKMIQKMMKAGRAFIQRDDADHYYVPGGCALVKVPTILYWAYIQTVSGYFIELEPGEKQNLKTTLHKKELERISKRL